MTEQKITVMVVIIAACHQGGCNASRRGGSNTRRGIAGEQEIRVLTIERVYRYGIAIGEHVALTISERRWLVMMKMMTR